VSESKNAGHAVPRHRGTGKRRCFDYISYVWRVRVSFRIGFRIGPRAHAEAAARAPGSNGSVTRRPEDVQRLARLPGLLAREIQFLGPLQQGRKRDPRLQARQRCADAGVDAMPERNMRIGIAHDVEAVGIAPDFIGEKVQHQQGSFNRCGRFRNVSGWNRKTVCRRVVYPPCRRGNQDSAALRRTTICSKVASPDAICSASESDSSTIPLTSMNSDWDFRTVFTDAYFGIRAATTSSIFRIIVLPPSITAFRLPFKAISETDLTTCNILNRKYLAGSLSLWRGF